MDETAPVSKSAPTSFWVISGISLLWNAFGGYDYIMSRTKNTAYLEQMGGAKDILAWIDAFPLWAQVLWPIGVWASVLGAILLLLRSRHAAMAFLVSLIGAIGGFIGQYSVPMPASLDTVANKVLPLVILASLVLFWWYSRKQVAAGVLR
jgi:hypothetical protein